jgi:uncharacterized membrane protein YgcG
MKLLIALPAIALLGGCATTNKDYLALLTAQQAVAVQNAEAAKARFNAMSQIAQTGDASSRTAAVMAMAMVQTPHVNLPPPPESEAFKWASIILPSVTNLGTGFFGYRLGVAQSNNNRDITVAGYNTFGTMATSGFAAVQNTATAGFNSNAQLGSFIQAPQPNITLSGTGVIGSGSFSAPVTTTTTTTSNSNNRNCTGGSGSGGGFGGNGTTAGAGAPGGSGGGANC